jgi:hypothetical protein
MDLQDAALERRRRADLKWLRCFVSLTASDTIYGVLHFYGKAVEEAESETSWAFPPAR